MEEYFINNILLILLEFHMEYLIILRPSPSSLRSSLGLQTLISRRILIEFIISYFFLLPQFHTRNSSSFKPSLFWCLLSVSQGSSSLLKWFPNESYSHYFYPELWVLSTSCWMFLPAGVSHQLYSKPFISQVSSPEWTILAIQIRRLSIVGSLTSFFIHYI